MSTGAKVDRRRLLTSALGGLVGVSVGPVCSPYLATVAHAMAEAPGRQRHCVLLWMSGGPSQLDTFDLKPGHANGGEFREIATSVPGLRWSEHLPRLAEHAQDVAVVRSVSTREGDHERGTYLMRTGRRPGTPIAFPTVGSSLAKEMSAATTTLPHYFSILPLSAISPSAFGPGFLGPRYAAATVHAAASDAQPNASADTQLAELRIENLTRRDDVSSREAQSRRSLWHDLQQGFLQRHRDAASHAHDTVYRRALDMMESQDLAAFDLSQEALATREAYGKTPFGQGCLLARRLIERGVPVVEVTLGQGLGWDTHQDNFRSVRNLSAELDQGWATLMTELRARGLLETTTILWMGEFGRTPQINPQAGRDHFPDAWSCVFCGGGIAGGQAFGATAVDGREVIEGKVDQGHVLATLCAALGIDPRRENISPEGRPHAIVEGEPIRAILTG